MKQKKRLISGGRNQPFGFLSLFENSVPKHDEYHQGNCENDHGSKF